MTLLALWFTTFAVCVAGAIIPFVNTEIYLISAVALSPASYAMPLVVAATFGQMVGKVVMFYGGRGVVKMRNERVRKAVEGLRTRLDRRPVFAQALLFSSSVVGLPPLYIMAVACGTIGMGIVPFFVIGLVGRFIHFTVVALVPQLARTIFSWLELSP